jgi:hypothetical protein
MKTFTQWVEDNNLSLTGEEIVTDAENSSESEETTDESKRRNNAPHAYPDGYNKGQYPDSAHTPHSATAALDIENAKKKKKK